MHSHLHHLTQKFHGVFYQNMPIHPNYDYYIVHSGRHSFLGHERHRLLPHASDFYNHINSKITPVFTRHAAPVKKHVAHTVRLNETLNISTNKLSAAAVKAPVIAKQAAITPWWIEPHLWMIVGGIVGAALGGYFLYRHFRNKGLKL